MCNRMMLSSEHQQTGTRHEPWVFYTYIVARAPPTRTFECGSGSHFLPSYWKLSWPALLYVALTAPLPMAAIMLLASLSPRVHDREFDFTALRLALQDETMSKYSLTDLPPELVLEVISHLSNSPSSLISLKLASKQLWFTAPQPPTDWLKTATDCQRTAAYRATRERKELLGGRRRCVHCGILAPTHRFQGTAPLCKWHQARFRSNSIPKHMESSLKIRLLLLTREKEEAVWIPITRMYCAHERETVGWSIFKCTCTCDSCGHFEVQCLLRISPMLDTPQISEPTEDGTHVTEEHWQPARTRWPSTIYPREVLGEPLLSYRKLVPIINLESLS